MARQVERPGRPAMIRYFQAAAMTGCLLVGPGIVNPAVAQKQGGILKVYHRDSPASMSILEEATISTVLQMMGVFNNLVVYDQNVKQNSLQSIVPDLATSWELGEDGAQLTFKLRAGVKWHDGKPFTAKDVAYTWDLLLGKATESCAPIRATSGTRMSSRSPPGVTAKPSFICGGRSRR